MNRSRRRDWATWLLLLVACRGDAPTQPVGTPPVPTTVLIVSGDRQEADPEDALAEPLRFKVLDAGGAPIPGVELQFSIPLGGGSVAAQAATTDSTGIATVMWTMGSLGGIQELQATINGRLMATATATTCDPAECFPPSRLSGALSDATLLSLATYESSGQAVHPDVVRGHGAATGYWMAITPYPNGNTLFENPSIFRSSTTAEWLVPTGAQNPLVRPDAPAYLSDPDIVVDHERRLWMYYRTVAGFENIIKVIRSSDGVHWDLPTTVITAPSHELVSPAVVRAAPQAPWQMWSVNAGPTGCAAPRTTIERRTSQDGIRWNEPVAVDLDQPGQAIWHIDVQWIPTRAEYWALYNTYAIGTSCTTNALYLARSVDGITWTTYPSPIARAGVVSAFRHLIYRSTFMTNPKATQVTLWMSGAEYSHDTYTWRTATVTTTVANLFGIASSPASLAQAAPFTGKLPPPEPDVGHDH